MTPPVSRASSTGCGTAATAAAQAGLEVHAGHGLTFNTVGAVARLPEIVELNIGHFLIGEAIFGGLDLRHPAHARPDGRGPRRGYVGPQGSTRRAMILGLGNDIIDIRRIEKTIARYGDRFLDACLHRHGAAEIGRPGRACRVLCQALCRQGGLCQGPGHRAEAGRVLARHGRRQPGAPAVPPWC